MSENLGDVAKQHWEAWRAVHSSGRAFAKVLTHLLRLAIPGAKISYYLDAEFADRLYVEAPQDTQAHREVYLEYLLERVFGECCRAAQCDIGDFWFTVLGGIHVSREQAEQVERVLKSHLCAAEREEAEKHG